MTLLYRLNLALFLFFLSVPFVFAVDYKGMVSITEKGKAARVKEYVDAVVYFVPKERVNTKQAVLERKEIIMKNKDFFPRVLPVMAGTEVNFPNFDPILHNAFSTSRNNEFDLGLYDNGKSAIHVFDKPGLIRVYCNVHHSMVAYVLAFDSPYFTVLEESGEFTLKDLPAVAGDLFIWHPRAKPLKQELDPSKHRAAGSYQIELTKRRVPKHENKDGISYREAKKRKY